jgi:uncharacterized protein YutE (UPF0331/DUF86 family)
VTPAQISLRIVSDRLALIAEYLGEIRVLPLDDYAAFMADRRNIWTAESCLRRILEALLDIGRHMLAKGFGQGVTEYKEIAVGLRDRQVLNPHIAGLFIQLAGYRNRMVHYYHEITPDELYGICTSQLGDLEQVADAYRQWVNAHPELIDNQL